MEVEEEDDFILARRYNVLEKFRSVNYEDKHGFVKEMSGEGMIKELESTLIELEMNV